MITVFTSCYNQAKYLPEAIESVLNQTCKNFEYRLYDDGSTDNTWQIISDYARRDSRIIPTKLDKTDNVGVVIKKCMEEMKGNVWTWCPSDDVWLPTLLEKKQQEAVLHPNAVFYSDWIVVDSNGNKITEIRPRLTVQEFREEVWKSCPIGFTGIWIPKSVIDEVGPFPTHLKYSEDFYWMLKAVVHGISFIGIPQILYKKRKHSNATTSRNIKAILDQVPVIRKEIRKYKSNILNKKAGK